MKGLDTNALVRYFTQDDIEQSALVNSLIDKHDEPFFINHIVLCELVWVLTRSYKYPKDVICDLLGKILVTRQFEIENWVVVRKALDEFENNNADFADCLIGILNQEQGCESTLSFDRGTKKLAAFSYLG